MLPERYLHAPGRLLLAVQVDATLLQCPVLGGHQSRREFIMRGTQSLGRFESSVHSPLSLLQTWPTVSLFPTYLLFFIRLSNDRIASYHCLIFFHAINTPLRRPSAEKEMLVSRRRLPTHPSYLACSHKSCFTDQSLDPSAINDVQWDNPNIYNTGRAESKVSPTYLANT
jgi:hypothetical protein